MKARPRRIENQIAALLSEIFVARGLDPVERKPVIGRTGPDLTINAAKFIVDVKSRQAVPRTIFGDIGEDGRLYYVPICDFPEKILKSPRMLFRSVQVRDWWVHMREWQMEHCPDGITMLALHRPGMRVDQSMLVFHHSQISNITERLK